jgi:hypothetical protein
MYLTILSALGGFLCLFCSPVSSASSTPVPSHFPHIPYNATAKSTMNQTLNPYFLPHSTVSASSLRSRDLNLEARQFQNEMENLISFQVCNFAHLNVAVWWGNKGFVVC